MKASLELDSVACDRGNRRLFDKVSLRLKAGEAGLVSGANGSGKSSLLRLVAGLLEPLCGEIRREGGISLADEHLALDRERSLEDALRFWAAIDGSNDVDAALALFSLDHLARVPVRMLSTGQRKRAVLARTVASGAHIWLLDEPGNGLDAASLDRLKAAVGAHLDAGGIVLVASHQPLGLDFAAEVAL